VLSDSQNDPLIGDLIHSDVLSQQIANLLPGFKVTGITTRVRACVADYQRFHTPWHQDLADESRSEGGCNTVRLTCWIPLSDVDENTGALACAPGHYPASIMQRQGTGGYKIIDEESLEKNKKVLKCNKGDALFLDRFLPHKSLPIQQNLSRWSIVNWIKAEPNNC
jgi:ectoine hydroxylase-related dioxygenase (phytanoyl-CoA dioxygenase family)